MTIPHSLISLCSTSRARRARLSPNCRENAVQQEWARGFGVRLEYSSPL